MDPGRILDLDPDTSWGCRTAAAAVVVVVVVVVVSGRPSSPPPRGPGPRRAACALPCSSCGAYSAAEGAYNTKHHIYRGIQA